MKKLICICLAFVFISPALAHMAGRHVDGFHNHYFNGNHPHNRFLGVSPPWVPMPQYYSAPYELEIQRFEDDAPQPPQPYCTPWQIKQGLVCN